MLIFCALLAGLVFGLGLIVSGMANPAKVLNFLDLAGPWDPSLMLVMMGAMSVSCIAFLIAERRSVSLLGAALKLSGAGKVDRRLALGATLFGIGWGIAGFCPGPSVVAIGMGQPKALIFVVAMLVGMGLFELVEMLRAHAMRSEASS